MLMVCTGVWDETLVLIIKGIEMSGGAKLELG